MRRAKQSEISPDEYNRLLHIEDSLVRLSLEMRQIADKSGLSRREIARRMGNASTSNLQRILSGAAYHATLETLSRLAWACGHDIQVTVSPHAKQPPLRYPKTLSEEKPSAPHSNNIVNIAEYVNRYAKQPYPEWPTRASNG